MNLVKKILGSWYEVSAIRVPFEIIFVIIPIAFMIRTFGFGLYQVPSGSMETTLLVGERFFSDKVSYWFRKPERGEIIAFNDPKYEYSSSTLMNLWQRYVSWNVMNVTKRVIGIPGDRVKGVIEDGHPVIYVNGKKLDESSYLNKYPLILLYDRPAFYRGHPVYNRATEQRSIVPGIAWDKQPFYKINPQLIVLNPDTGNPASVVYPGTPLPSGKDIFDVQLGDDEYWVMGDNRLGSSDSRMWKKLKGNLIHGRIIFRIWSMDTSYSWWFFDLLKNPIGFWRKVRWSRIFQFVK